MKGFKEFLLRGNVMDLAVAVVIGAAFTAVVTAVVTYLISPIVGAVFNVENFSKLWVVQIPLTAGTAKLQFGALVGAIINFVIIAAVVYFVFVLPMNHLMKVTFRKQQEEPASAEPAPPTELDLLAQIRDLLEGQQQVGDRRLLKTD